jgi:hypothetical protein
LLGAHLADLLSTDRRRRDGLLFSLLKSAAGSDGPFRYAATRWLPPARTVLSLQCIVLRDIEIVARFG